MARGTTAVASMDSVNTAHRTWMVRSRERIKASQLIDKLITHATTNKEEEMMDTSQINVAMYLIDKVMPKAPEEVTHNHRVQGTREMTLGELQAEWDNLRVINADSG